MDYPSPGTAMDVKNHPTNSNMKVADSRSLLPDNILSPLPPSPVDNFRSVLKNMKSSGRSVGTNRYDEDLGTWRHMGSGE